MLYSFLEGEGHGGRWGDDGLEAAWLVPSHVCKRCKVEGCRFQNLCWVLHGPLHQFMFPAFSAAPLRCYKLICDRTLVAMRKDSNVVRSWDLKFLPSFGRSFG